MEATLTNTEMETIAKMVSDRLHARFIAEWSNNELKKASERYTNEMIGFYLKENSVSYDVRKMIKPILDEHLKETKVVEEKLRSYMNTEHFKKIELKNLKERVCQIERELNQDEDY